MRIFFVIWFICAGIYAEAAIFYARQDGNWNDRETWSYTQGGAGCGSIPGPGDDVVIDGYRVVVASDAATGSVVLCADERDAESGLRIEQGTTLRVAGAVKVQSTQNIYQNIELLVLGSLEVGGDLTFNRAANNNRNRKLGLYLEGGTALVTGDVNFIYAGAAVGEQDPEIEMTGAAHMECHAVNFTESGGGEVNIVLSGTSSWRVEDDYTIHETGGSDFGCVLSENASVAVGGDFTVVKSGGEDLDLSFSGESQLMTRGNFTVDWNGSDSEGSDMRLHLADQSLMDVGEKLDIQFDEEKDNCDVLLELEDQAQMQVGTEGGNTGEAVNIAVNSGQKLNIYLDGDSELKVFGDCNLHFAGDDHFYITLNGKNAGWSLDARLAIDGDLSVSKSSGDAFRIALFEDAHFQVEENVDIGVTGHDENAQHDEIELNDRADMKIGGDLSFKVDVSNNNNLVMDLNDHSSMTVGEDDGRLSSNVAFEVTDGYSLYFMLDDEAHFVAYGPVSFAHGGNGNMHIDLNYYTPDDASGAQMTVAGNLTVAKTDGDRFRISASSASQLDVGGNFTYTSTGHDAGSTTDESLILNDDASMYFHGNFFMQMDDPEQNNDLAIDLNDRAILSTGSGTDHTAVLHMINGARYVLRLDGSATWNVNGKLQLIYGNSAQSYDMGLNLADGEAAVMHVTGDFEMKNDKNTDLLRFVLNGAASLLKVDGNIDFRGAKEAGRLEIELRNTAQLSIGGDFLRNDAPENYGILDFRDQSALEFAGDGRQNWPRTEGGGTDGFYIGNVRINNTGSESPQILLQEDVDYLPPGGRVQFMNGVIGTGAYVFCVNGDDPGALASFNERSYVCGNLRRHVRGGATYDFPVGSPDHYEPVRLNFPGDIGATSYIEARFTVSDENPAPCCPPLSVNGVEITEFLDYGYWTLTADAGAPAYDITVESRGHTNGGSVASQHAIFKRDADVWSSEGLHDNSTQRGAGADAIAAERKGLTGFSDFIIGRSADEPLPVTWCSFAAAVEENKVVLTWRTHAEINNDYFSVERSPDGNDFMEIARIDGAGTSGTGRAYRAVDHFPLSGVSYYRLAQTDFDGSVEYSNIVVVRAGTGMPERDGVVLRPNPVYRGNPLTLMLDPAMRRGTGLSVKVTDVAGAGCDVPVAVKRNAVTIDTAPLASGSVYLLFIVSDTWVVIRKLVVL